MYNGKVCLEKRFMKDQLIKHLFHSNLHVKVKDEFQRFSDKD